MKLLDWLDPLRGFSIGARAAYVNAMRIAAGESATAVSSAHLAAGVVAEPSALTRRIFEQSGLDLPGVHPTIEADGSWEGGLTRDGKRSLSGARSLARRLGHQMVYPETLLLAAARRSEDSPLVAAVCGARTELRKQLHGIEERSDFPAESHRLPGFLPGSRSRNMFIHYLKRRQ